MTKNYFEQHPREYEQMLVDWAATNDPDKEPSDDFVKGWYMARKPLNTLQEKNDIAAQMLGELIMALSLEGVDYQSIVEKWREE